MTGNYSDQQLQAYLDESLHASLLSQIEADLRANEQLRQRLAYLAGQREAGIHGLGEIWRRRRLTCPTRQQLGSYLLRALDADQEDYIQFHLEEVGCRVCLANLEDLQRQRTEQLAAAKLRRQRYFQSSAGYLSRRSSED